MTESFDIALTDATIVKNGDRHICDIGIRDGRIVAMGSDIGKAAKKYDCRGLVALPGIIDSHVHLREPGVDSAIENLASGSAAAVMGGVTTVFDMPNTIPPTITANLFSDKLMRASGRMACNYGFYIGASKDNIECLNVLSSLPACSGVKVFVGSSTGNLLVDDDADLETIFKVVPRLMVFHAEDEDRLQQRLEYRIAGQVASHSHWRDEIAALNATKKLIKLAEKYSRFIHILHVTSGSEIKFLADHREFVSTEVTVDHLTLSGDDYERLGTLMQVNPPIRDKNHRQELWRALAAGKVDTIGSDHAPHSLSSKRRDYPQSPSGAPGVQTLLPIMLDHVAKNRLSLERLIDLTSANPARIFGVVGKGKLDLGYDADITLVDLDYSWTITNDWILSGCGWTPYDGMRVKGLPVGTFVNGDCAMWQGELVAKSAGRPVLFADI